MGKYRNSNHQNRKQDHGGYKSSRSRRRDPQDVGKLPGLVLTEDHFRGIKSVQQTPLAPRTPNQKAYYESIMRNDLTFGVGPEGTGKTFVGLATGCELFKSGAVDRIICSRAAVGAEEEPGFYPGDENEKISPWLMACREVLDMRLGKSAVDSLIQNDRVKFVPFAIMRGLNWRDAFVLLDEAQNTTPTQMRLFLTRHVTGSRIVVDGGLAQKDTPDFIEDGLKDAIGRLGGLPGVGLVEFTTADIVRSEFVKMVVEAYDRD